MRRSTTCRKTRTEPNARIPAHGFKNLPSQVVSDVLSAFVSDVVSVTVNDVVSPCVNKELSDYTDETNSLTYPITFPMSYGAVEVQQSSVLQNQGNSESWPVFVVAGQYPTGFTIYNPNTGQKVIMEGSGSDTVPAILDFASGSVTVGGIDRSYLLTSCQWFSIPPNSAIKPRFIPHAKSNTGVCDVIYSDTWI